MHMIFREVNRATMHNQHCCNVANQHAINVGLPENNVYLSTPGLSTFDCYTGRLHWCEATCGQSYIISGELCLYGLVATKAFIWKKVSWVRGLFLSVVQLACISSFPPFVVLLRHLVGQQSILLFESKCRGRICQSGKRHWAELYKWDGQHNRFGWKQCSSPLFRGNFTPTSF